MPGNLLASMVFPEPGGPIIRTLWAPAAATSKARLAVVWPRTSRKSRLPGLGCQRDRIRSGFDRMKLIGLLEQRHGFGQVPDRKNPDAFDSMAASGPRFPPERSDFGCRDGSAATAIERTPRTGRTLPSSDSSPTNKCSSTREMTPIAPRIPSDIGLRSKPWRLLLRTLAGARLMVTDLLG